MLLATISGLTIGGCLFLVARYTNTPKWLLYAVGVFGLAAMNYKASNVSQDSLMFTQVVGGAIVLGVAMGIYLRRSALKPKPPENSRS